MRVEQLRQRATRVAVVVAAMSAVALLAVASGRYLTDAAAGSGRYAGLFILGWVGFPVVGAVLAARRPAHGLGWVLLAAGMGVAVAVSLDGYLAEAAGRGADGAVGRTLATVHSAAFVIGAGSLPVIVALFPSGAIVGRVRRRVAVTYVAAWLLALLAYQLRGFTEVTDGVVVPTVLSAGARRDVVESVIPVLVCAMMVFGVTAVVDAVRRYRRAANVERLQMKWFAVAVAAMPLLYAASLPVHVLRGAAASDLLINAVLLIGLNAMATAIGLAVLRYRLYDIDRVVSRTVTYSVVTVVLVAVYAAGALVPSALFDWDSSVHVAAATLAVAAAFRPVRAAVQNAVDRRFNRPHYDAVRMAERFAHQLRLQTDLGEVSAELRDVVANALQPQHVSVWLARR